MNKNITELLMITLTVLLLNIQNSYGQKHSSASAHTSYTGLSMTGYQGWFGTPNDGGTNNWRHYNGSTGFKPGSASIEYWPDMREADKDEIHSTEFTFKDGSTATVFSSVNPKTVKRHFQWMKEYRIDGAFVQRFKSDFGIRTTLDKVMLNALEGAEINNRAIAVMYDIGANIYENGTDTASVNSTRTYHVNEVFNDWKHLVDELGLTTRGDHQAYLYHNGKPMVALWGVGFPHRHNSNGLDMRFWIELVDKFQNDPEYGGCSILLGVPTYWLQGGNDCITGSEHAKMLDLIKKCDAIMPWHTSRFERSVMATIYKSLVTDDLTWCTAANVAYAPCISPGIREKILAGNGYEKYREGGYYFWDMAKAAVEAGSKMLYLGMFDEIDEGTQLNKINNNPPFYSTAVPFATYGTDPEDHYLWLAGEATRAMRGEFTMGPQYRTRATDTDFQSEITFTDKDSTYEMQLTASGSGRKVFYADPYEVRDGAPTVGTKRDTSLFANELINEMVTFSAEQRGQCIRFVEVDSATAEIITFKAIVATNGFAEIPYSTSFEDGRIDPKFWAIHTENSSGRINVTNNFEPKTGAFHLSFDADSSGTSSINSASLHVNLKGIIRDIMLNFSYKTFGTEVNPEDGIYFSNDGGTSFSKVFGFPGTTSVYKDTSLNINALTELAGLSFTEKFVIRFQHKDIKPITDGGMVLDDIKIFYPFTSPEILVENFLTFDGKDDFVDCGRDASLQIAGAEITVEAWFKINNAKPATYQSTILAMDHSEANNDVGYFMRANGNGQIEWGFGDGTWHEIKSEDGVRLFDTGNWNHVAGVYDGTYQKIYLNGNLIAKGEAFTTTLKGTPNENLYIGSTPSFSNRVIDAGLAEVRIWNVARIDSEIKEFATKRITGSETGLAGYWPINEGEGQIIGDITPNGNNGILGGTTDVSMADPIWTEGIPPLVDIKNITLDNPDQFELIQNYPNPFSTSTTISYVLPENSEVQLNIFNIYGQKMAELVNQKMNAGTYEVICNAPNLVGGIYLIGLKTKSGFVTKKMILSK